MKNNKLIYYLFDWVFRNPTQVRQFENIVELHYFLIGYQMSESNNLLSNGDGHWISDFMIHCDSFLHEKLRDDLNYKSGFNYIKKIQLLQKDDKDGLFIFYTIFKQFVISLNNNIDEEKESDLV